jgi:hypothetical protein
MQPASHALSRAEGRASLNLHFALRTSPRSSFSLALHLFIKKGQSPGRLEGTETLHRLSPAGFPLFLSPVGPGLEVLPLFLVRPSLAFHLISSRLSSPPFQPTLNPPKSTLHFSPLRSSVCTSLVALLRRTFLTLATCSLRPQPRDSNSCHESGTCSHEPDPRNTSREFDSYSATCRLPPAAFIERWLQMVC